MFDNINEVWAALRNCKSATELGTMIGNIPNKFGKWEMVVGENNKVTITNSYFDGQLDDWYDESEDFYVEVGDMYNEEECIELWDAIYSAVHSAGFEVEDDADDSAIVSRGRNKYIIRIIELPN